MGTNHRTTVVSATEQNRGKSTGLLIPLRTRELPCPSPQETGNHWKDMQTHLRRAAEMEKGVCGPQMTSAFKGNKKRLGSAGTEGAFQTDPILRRHPWEENPN